MTIVNLMPYPITVFTEQGVLRLEPAQEPLRIESRRAQTGEAAHHEFRVPVHTVMDGRCDAPPVCDGTVYVVSASVAEVLNRDDVLFPVDLVRDDEGRVVGCGGLARKF